MFWYFVILGVLCFVAYAFGYGQGWYLKELSLRPILLVRGETLVARADYDLEDSEWMIDKMDEDEECECVPDREDAIRELQIMITDHAVYGEPEPEIKEL